jgi:hypothetical protein
MAHDPLTAWIKKAQRNGLLFSALYAAIVLIGGAIAFLLEFAVLFIIVKILILIALPDFAFRDLLSVIIGAAILGVFFLDSVHSSRDDMTFLPLWLLREYISIGPRAILEGSRSAVEAYRFAFLDVEFCGKVLSYLAWKNKAIPKDELLTELPDVDWKKVVEQVGLLEGVLIFGTASRITLTFGLRLELRSFGVRKRTKAQAPQTQPDHEAEPEPISVYEPEKLSPREILGVSDSATAAEIKAAYRRRVKECHPDRFAGMDEQTRLLAEEWTKAVNSAYHALLAQVR